jgi:hypothetical protein
VQMVANILRAVMNVAFSTLIRRSISTSKYPAGFAF